MKICVLVLGTFRHHFFISPRGYLRNLASWRCLKQSSLSALNLEDLGFLSFEKDAEKSFLIPLVLSLSSLAREIRCSRFILLKESFCCKAKGRFSRGQIDLIIDQLDSSSESSELEEVEELELELELLEEEDFFFLFFLFLSFFLRFLVGFGLCGSRFMVGPVFRLVETSAISESDKI